MTRRKLNKFLALLLFLPSESWAQRKRLRPKPKRGKPPQDFSPFRAIPGISQKIQNEQADRNNLERLRNDKDFEELRQDKRLVPLPIVPGLKTKDLNPKWRFCRPWTAQFLEDLTEAHRKEKSFRKKTLFITSAVRTMERQAEIVENEKNRNAVEVGDENPSVHLTGTVVDITKRKMNRQQILWMRRTLLPLHEKTIYVVEEFSQPCFHIMVYKNYQKPANW